MVTPKTSCHRLRIDPSTNFSSDSILGVHLDGVFTRHSYVRMTTNLNIRTAKS